MEEVIEITESQLAVALEKWEKQAAENKWAERTDADRHRDNAKYLMGLLRSA